VQGWQVELRSDYASPSTHTRRPTQKHHAAAVSSPLPPALLAGPDRAARIVGPKRQTAQVLDRAFALRAHGIADRERRDQTPHAFAQLQREGRCCRPGQLVDVMDRRLTAAEEALGVLGLAHGRRPLPSG
jgi:hypothetical protein